MQPINQTDRPLSGTAKGASISMLLLIAFGLSSYVVHQKVTPDHAAEHANRAIVVSAYLA